MSVHVLLHIQRSFHNKHPVLCVRSRVPWKIYWKLWIFASLFCSEVLLFLKENENHFNHLSVVPLLAAVVAGMIFGTHCSLIIWKSPWVTHKRRKDRSIIWRRWLSWSFCDYWRRMFTWCVFWCFCHKAKQVHCSVCVSTSVPPLCVQSLLTLHHIFCFQVAVTSIHSLFSSASFYSGPRRPAITVK